MTIAASPLAERKRVKVYELRESDWFDRGTGFCAVQTISDHGEVVIASEDDPELELLKITIKKDDNYQTQQGTLIVWTDPENGREMALSFQEAEGCGVVWDTINDAQSSIEGYVKPVIVPFIDLPIKPGLGVLDKIEKALGDMSKTQVAREAMIKHLATEDYVAQTLELVSEAEGFESIEDLHKLCNIMKQFVLYNDNSIIDAIIQNEVFENALGALEYDPDFPNHKANHREFLNRSSIFKEVVPIKDDDIRRKIQFTYRLQYLKDVALARVLDDPSFSLFNSIIYFYQLDIIQWIATNNDFTHELFSTVTAKTTSVQAKKDAISFIQQSCAIAKSVQAPTRSSLYHNYINAGLFGAINFALQHKDSVVRVAGTDILVAIIDHDMMMMRNTVHKSANDHMNPMTETLIDLLLVETDVGVKAQVADAIKVLLDSAPNAQSESRFGGNDINIVAKFRTGGMNNVNRNFLEHHLQPSMKKLFTPLLDLEKRETLVDLTIHEKSLFSHLVEILSFFVRQPASMSKTFILTEGLIPRTALLLTCPDKHVKLTAIKFFRTCVAASDPGDHYVRALIQHNIFENILDLIIENMPRDNLLMSACLELFEFCRAHKVRPVIFHIVETLREMMESINFVPLFHGILGTYHMIMDATLDNKQQIQNGDMDSSFMTSDDGSPNIRHEIIQGGGTRWQGLRDTSMEEDAYFNSADDDEDELSRDSSIPNSASPLAKPLVDYGDDDDEDIITDTPPNMRKSYRETELNSSSPVSPQDGYPSDKENLPSSSTPPTSTPPPPSLTEKRRREEEDDDELVKLSTSTAKRRNSGANSMKSVTSDASWDLLMDESDSPTPAAANKLSGSPEGGKDDSPSGTPKLQTLRRKRGLGPCIGGAGRKIAISLSGASTVKEKSDIEEQEKKS